MGDEIRLTARAAAAILGIALCAPQFASAQQAAPAPGSRAAQNAAVVNPLTEIGRVRSRTPYCSALARARPGIETAVAYEYAVLAVAHDLRTFKLNSGLGKAQSLRKSQDDLERLGDLAKTGRDDVRALRGEADAAGLDPEKKRELQAFANALDGAKARQEQLAKSLARVLAVLAEARLRDAANAESDDHGPSALAGRSKGSSRQAAIQPAANAFDQSNPQSFTTGQAEAVEDAARLQQIFGSFGAELAIRDDLKTAADHGLRAMKLGGCESNEGVNAR